MKKPIFANVSLLLIYDVGCGCVSSYMSKLYGVFSNCLSRRGSRVRVPSTPPRVSEPYRRCRAFLFAFSVNFRLGNEGFIISDPAM